MKYNTLRNLAWILKNSLKLDKILFVYLALYIFFRSIPDIVLIVMPRFLIDELLGAQKTENIIIILGIAFLVFVISTAISRFTYYKSWPRYIVIRMELKKQAAQKYTQLKQSETEDPRMLNLSERADQATTFNENGFEGMFRQSVETLSLMVSLIVCLVIISTFNVGIVFLILVLIVVPFLYNTYVKRYEKKLNDDLAPINRKIEYIFNTTVESKTAKDIRIFDLLPWLTSKFNNSTAERRVELKKIEKKRLNSNILSSFLNVILELALYVWIIYAVFYLSMSIGTFIMLAAAIRTFFSQLNTTFSGIAHVRQQSLLMNDFIDFINYEEDKGEKPIEPLSSVKTDGENKYTLQLQNVSFKYPSSDRYALHNINLTIKSGEKLAIVGANGSGKTTFVKLITKLYEPTEGKILLNGRDIKYIDRSEYYRLFAVVFQDIVLFAFPIIENISLQPKDETDLDRVIKHSKDAMIYDTVMGLPKKYDTSVLKIIDEEGIEFSGGEKQKIALTRSLYRDAPIMILDEPSASLDAIAENNIYKQYNKFSKDKLSIFISHRLASTQFCDYILMFDQGEIIEQGTHRQLMENNGPYMKMFQVQAKYYKTEEGQRDGGD